ncbi:MAG: EAL domain-containing protein [Cetobacterium sp.]
MFIKFYVIFLLLTSIAFGESYIPKNLEEKRYLSELRNKKITIGLLNNEFYNIDSEDGISLNKIMKKLFSDYLNLNVEFKEDSYYNLKQKAIKGEIDVITLINRDNCANASLDFTTTIFSEDLFVVSTKGEIHTLEELNGKNIYTTKGFVYKNYASAILLNNDIKANIIEVDNLNDYKEQLILTPTPVLYDAIFGTKISNSGGVSIGVSHELSKLIPILDNALNEKYRSLTSTTLSIISKELALENFYNSLTFEELDYLSSLKELKVVYENEYNTLMSYKSEVSGEYKGVFPTTLNLIGSLLKLKIIDLTDSNLKTLNDLNKGDFHMIALSQTRNRSKDFLFSKKIYEIGLYVVNLKNPNESKRNIGVLKDSVEEQIALRYDISDNVLTYKNFQELIKALNNREVDNILTANTSFFDPKVYDLSFFENIPVNMTFSKKNEILRDIFNKALIHLINKEDIYKYSSLEKEAEDKIILNTNKQIKRLLNIFTIFLFFGTILAVIKLYIEKKHKQELLKDPLTGLNNRFVFNSFCHDENKTFNGYAFAIDLNNFKKVNDTLGHEHGDSIIVEFSNFLKEMFGNTQIFRISGDEFYGFLNEDPKMIIDKFNKYTKFCPEMVRYGVSFTAGLCEKKDSISVTETFKYADLAMFEAKNKKKFSFKIADEEFILRKKREELIFNNLKDNLDGIYPVFQPKIDLKTDKIIGAEALARYNSQTLGVIAPFEFIPIAEKFNFIHKIDYAIADKAMEFIKSELLGKRLPSNFRLSFNISVVTFKRGDFIDVLKDLLQKHDISGKYFEVEITESVFITDIQDLIDKLKALSNLELLISLDDFTAGHSTAGILPLLPINIVKFDKSLLDSIEINRDKGNIVYKNLISLIKELNLKIVAEGVETLEQLNFLKSLEVEYAQGYYISKPVDARESLFQNYSKK